MAQPARFRIFAILAPAFLAGCGAGTAAIVDAASDSGGGGGNASPSISTLVVEDAKVSPARVRFSLRDQESNPAEVSIFYEVPGAASRLITTFQGLAGNPITLDTSREGIEYEFVWSFTQEGLIPDDGSFFEDVSVFATVTGGTQGIEPGANQFGLGVGNDPPAITQADGPVEEVTGVLLATFTVADSSNDIVSVAVEFDIVGDDPDAGWQVARPGLEDSTPEFAFENILASKEGSSFVFTWDTNVDLEDLERDVRLRFTAMDGIEVSVPKETATLRVDNNDEPVVSILEGAFLTHTEVRNGIPVSYDVFDEEGDAVEVVFQWRRPGESYPELPSDPAKRAEILDDPEERREHRIASEFPTFVEGRVVPVDENSVRLPEIASGPGSVLAGRLEGCELQILRSSSVPEAIAHTWVSNLLQGPVAALAVGEGISVLVLDAPSPGSWRLREIELGTGDVVRDVAEGSDGDPSAMTYELGEDSVLIATVAGEAWSVNRVDLEGADVTPLIAFDGSTEMGQVRSIASLSEGTSVVTVSSSLVMLDYTDSAESKALTLLSGLHTPWGLVVDPLNPGRVYLSERDSAAGDPDCEQLGACGRVLSFDLNTRAIFSPVIRLDGESGPWFPSPQALALERSGTRLLVVVDAVPGDGVQELMGVDLGGPSGNEVFHVAVDLPDAGGLTSDRSGLRLLAMPGLDDLAVGGGIEQKRTILEYDPTQQVASVADSFSPVPDPSKRWRIPRSSCPPALTQPRRSLVWDSRDVGFAGSSEVLLRALPFDGERGLKDETSIPKLVVRPFEDRVLLLGDEQDMPDFVTAADLDGDGDQDLIYSDSDDESMTVFFQSRTGVFDPPSFVVDYGPTSIVAVDLDGDGDLDLATADYCYDNLAIFFQTKPGVFDESILELGDCETTFGAYSIAAGDLDGDGDLDLVSANSSNDNLTVFFQIAAGDFDPEPLVLGDCETTEGPDSVVVADLDGDGDLDIVSSNECNDSLTIFFQSTAGEFDPDPLLLEDSEMFQPQSVAAFDLDGDGDLDLVSANFSDNLTVFFQSSPGAFDDPPLVLGDSLTTLHPTSVTVADFDQDGDLDLVSANALGSDNLTVFFQSAAGVFETQPLVLGGPQLTGLPRSIAASDLDGDGRIDIVSANVLNKPLTVFFQGPTGVFETAPLVLGETTLGAPRSVNAADLDGDGDLDLVSANGGDSIEVFFQSAAGAFEDPPLVLGDSQTTDGPRSVIAADLDGDGDLDLISANRDGDTLSVFFQSAAGLFGATPLVLGDSKTTDGPRFVAAADLDGDGDLDLVSANELGNTLTVFFQSAAGVFEAQLVLGNSKTTGGPVFVAAADLDADGDLDLVSANYSSDTLTVFFQSAPGVFETSPLVLGDSETTNGPQSVAAADMDGDGDLDLVSANVVSDTLTVFFQSAAGVFEAEPLVLGDSQTTDGPQSVAAADLDGNGNLDLVSANSGSLFFSNSETLTVFFQTAAGVFESAPLVLGDPQTTNGPISVSAADLDGDGDLDLVSANSRGDSLTVFWNKD